MRDLLKNNFYQSSAGLSIKLNPKKQKITYIEDDMSSFLVDFAEHTNRFSLDYDKAWDEKITLTDFNDLTFNRQKAALPQASCVVFKKDKAHSVNHLIIEIANKKKGSILNDLKKLNIDEVAFTCITTPDYMINKLFPVYIIFELDTPFYELEHWKEFYPWFVKSVLRITGFNPLFSDLNHFFTLPVPVSINRKMLMPDIIHAQRNKNTARFSIPMSSHYNRYLNEKRGA